ncbi:polysaccharide deacetylase family protein [Kitasatospora camelliae]|uniref:Polysaccharide deacetylase family protein n=1 Tax=Kitasatospora camelliae TaxID=3156397 RepID=A0AAU8K6R1_9ACTN
MPISSSSGRRRAPAGWIALALLLAGCAAPTAAPETGPVPAGPPAAPTAQAAAAAAAAQGAQPAQGAQQGAPVRAARQQEQRQAAQARRDLAAHQSLAVAQRWGLAAAPLPAPPAPAVKPALVEQPGVKTRPGLPPVVYRVPTAARVVFLTVDDGAEKDPEFRRMAGELGVPLSAFLSDYLARSDYGYFRALRDQGAGIQNHTLTHPDLRRLDAAGQRREICGQQDRLEAEFGVRPTLFRPPYGEYTDATLTVARECGITALPLWNEEAFPDRMEWRYADQKLHPGDIILTHFRGAGDWKGTMPEMLRRVLDTVTAQGFALARLEDYL